MKQRLPLYLLNVIKDFSVYSEINTMGINEKVLLLNFKEYIKGRYTK